jgi:peroxiredoxin
MIVSCDKAEGTSLETENAKSFEIERLMGELGIIQVPHIAPPVDFSLFDLNSKKITLSDLKGKIIFLNFWTTWCWECREEMPLMQELYNRFKDKKFAMLAINLNEPEFVVKKFFLDKKLTFTALLDSDGDLGVSFGIRGIPTTYILDREGAIIGKVFGSREWNGRKSISLFEYLLKNSHQGD